MFEAIPVVFKSIEALIFNFEAQAPRCRDFLDVASIDSEIGDIDEATGMIVRAFKAFKPRQFTGLIWKTPKPTVTLFGCACGGCPVVFTGEQLHIDFFPKRFQATVF